MQDLEYLKKTLNPRPKTLEKITTLQDLLLKGHPPSEAVWRVKLGWKNYYKYLLLIYDRVPIPLKKEDVRDYEFRGLPVQQLLILMDYPAKWLAARGVRMKAIREGLRNVDIGREWFMLCQELKKRWIDEIWWSVFKGESYSYSLPSGGGVVVDLERVILRDAGYAWLIDVKPFTSFPVIREGSTKIGFEMEFYFAQLRDGRMAVSRVKIPKGEFREEGLSKEDVLEMSVWLNGIFGIPRKSLAL